VSKRVVLVGRDAAPSGCFKQLEPILKERGFEVNLIVGEGKPLTKSIEEIASTVSGANVVVLGMSSSLELAQPEIFAGSVAKNAKVPYGFYGDVPRCWARAQKGSWFEELAPDAAFYFGVTQSDADMAHEVFSNAQLIGTGNPLREEMAFPHFTREEVRAKLNILPEEKMILSPGNKFAAGNMILWAVIMDALKFLEEENQCFQLILAIHPGDRTPYAIDATTQKEMNLYEELISFSPVPARIVNKDVFTTSDMVSGADIIVEFGSSIGIEGAYQNIPVVNLGFEILFRQWEQVLDTRMLETASDGSSEIVVADASKLAETIQRLLTVDGFARMLEHQQEQYPKTKKRGTSLRNLADTIEQII